MNIQSKGFTKAELIERVNIYNNGEGISSYVWAALNSMNPCSTEGKGILRCMFDSPQYKVVHDFMQRKYFQKLGDNEPVSFKRFHRYVCRINKEHRFDEIYMDGTNAVVKTIIRPWFRASCTKAERKTILEHNDEVFEKRPKSFRHQVSEIKDGCVSIVPNTINAALSPIQTCKNLGHALRHPVNTVGEVKSLIKKRPAYVLGTALASAAIPSANVALGVSKAAQKASEAAHVGAMVSEMGEKAKHRKKKGSRSLEPVSLECGY